MKNNNNKNLMKYYIRDFLLWIFLIFFIIFITNLSKKYEIVKHIVCIISLIFILYRMFNMFHINRIKMILVWIGCIVYLYKDSFTKNIYENYVGYIVFVNLVVLIFPAFYTNNYHLGLLLLLSSLLTPIYMGKYDEHNFKMFNILYIYVIIIFFIYGSSVRHCSLLFLLSIIPMLIQYNQNPYLYRIISLLIMSFLYTNKYGLFYSQYRYDNIFTISTKKISNNHLADLVFKYNDWKTSKIYIIFIIIGYILTYNTYIFMKKNNIKTFIT